jgi:hypothetical protein
MEVSDVMETSANCPLCGAVNARSNNYCVQCGKSLILATDALLAGLRTEAAKAEIDRQVRAVLATVTTKEFVEREATTEVATKVIKLVKQFSIVFGVILSLLIASIALWGIGTIDQARHKVTEAAKNSAEQAKQGADEAAKNADQYKRNLDELVNRAKEGEASAEKQSMISQQRRKET